MGFSVKEEEWKEDGRNQEREREKQTTIVRHLQSTCVYDGWMYVCNAA